MEISFYIALVTLLFFLLWGIEIYFGGRKMGWVRDIPCSSANSLPKVSIVIPALNEEKDIEEALTAVLSLEYKNIEILAINDRSTDKTGEILERIAKKNPRLQVYHIETLPSGWLGKNHALHFGSQQATGQYLLFTDADVMIEPTTLNRSIHYMEENRLDHLAVGPEIRQEGILLNILTIVFIGFFGTFMKPWKAIDPKSKHFIGVGAFNLIRTEAYRNCGTLEAIAMRPDDDIKLGKLLKKQGFRQDYLSGIDMISLEWYPSVKDMINGLMKNTFAIFEYKVFPVFIVTVAILILDIWPFFGILLTDGITQVLNGAIIFIIYLGFGVTAHIFKKNPWYIFGYPVGCLIIVYILWRATVTTLHNQGINWRGTHYPLKQLKANRI